MPQIGGHLIIAEKAKQRLGNPNYLNRNSEAYNLGAVGPDLHLFLFDEGGQLAIINTILDVYEAWNRFLQYHAVRGQRIRIFRLGGCPRMPFCPNSSLFAKNNARNVNNMAVLIFFKCLDFEQNCYSRTTSYILI